ncbi:hypothetical protein [Brachybacterium aquaticum]|uniref:Uncharacterized protein n=1 Tax=Brachybacterium aquaticum TaxID=1432564 RepID=A0A841AGL0_9MICO|nr:hypothetical protein [Brachybacterium aquaticum]MBB5833133.1 hypothetical protein [Brachybacterium aquaticum]
MTNPPMDPPPPSAPPTQEPVRAATALVVVTALLLLGSVLTEVAGAIVDPSQAYAMLGTVANVVIVVVALAALAVLLGLGIAALVLAILVTVRGSGKLRIGAVMIIIGSLLGLAVSFTVTGDISQMPDAAVAAGNAFALMERVVDVLRGLVMLAGVVVVILGISEVRRKGAARA